MTRGLGSILTPTALFALLTSTMAVLLVGSYDAFAGTLVITGRSELAVVGTEGGVPRLQGTYWVKNSGNEIANAVSPQFELGAWSWVGEPKTLEQGAELAWQVNADLDRAKLACSTSDRCAGLQLPNSGVFPMLVTRHYQDVNGYRFSATEMQPIVIDVDAAKAAMLLIPTVTGKLTIDGNGSSFDVRGQLINTSSSETKVAVSLFTSRELRILSAPQVVVIPADQLGEFEAKLENFSGVVGSNYVVHAIIQWEDGEVRRSASLMQVASIVEPSQASFYLGLIAGVVLLLAGALYYFVFR